MKKRTIWKKFGDFLEGKGFYIVLFLCVAAIGGSGYYLYRTVSLADQMPSQSVSAKAEVPASAVQKDDVEVNVDANAAANKAKTASEEEAAASSEGDKDLEATPSKKATEQAEQAQSEKNVKQTSTDSQTTTASSSTKWAWPLDGKVVEAFSTKTLTYNEAMGDWRTHSGVDISAKVGDSVTAAVAGTVISVKDDVMLGKTVTIQTSDKLNTIYGNLADKVSVTSGDSVKAGQVIGKVGETAAGEKHDTAWLHFGVEKNSKAVDPTKYLEKQTTQTTKDK